MRGTHLHHESWKELIAYEKHGGPLVPILALAYERDLDPEMRPYKDRINPELRDKLILGISGAAPAIYRYFAPLRRRVATGRVAERTAYRQAEQTKRCFLSQPAMNRSLERIGLTSRNGKNRTLRHQTHFCPFVMAISSRSIAADR
jgi:hypothetical protein